MAASSWALRHPNVRSGRFHRSRHTNKEDDINLNISADPGQNIVQILSAICQPSELSDGKRLNYLNAFVRVTLKIDGNFENVGFTINHILCCLRITLVHESTLVRSGGLRAIRHVLRNENDVVHLNKLLIPFLIARSLDLILKSDVERFEAMKLIRKILLLSPMDFDISLARSLVALANGGIEEKDRMLRICLATLCELGVMNTNLFIKTGGVAAITRNLLECQTPKIAESLCGVLLLLLDKPSTRSQAAVNLYSIAAPYCDFHYRQGWKDKDKYGDERELRFNCSRLALLSLLKSWPGILHFCQPTNREGFKAIVDVLYLNQLEVRKAILDVLYELLGLPQPEWTDELSVALNAVDPCEPQSSWRLNEGFVAAEGRFILPHLAKTTPSINDMHLAFLLYCFLECGLLGALVEVIATSDTFISVRATVLLGELLHLIQIMLPPECCNVSPPLPSLLEYATRGQPQAVQAINGLLQLQKLLKKRPASYSLHLDYILRNGSNIKYSQNKESKKTRHKLKGIKIKLQQLVIKDGDDVIKESGVLLNKDAYTWNWNWIRIILKGETINLDLKETSHKNFMKRLVDFYTPSRNRYSHMDLTSSRSSLAYTMTGIDLIYCLLSIGDEESDRFLKDLFTDILEHITAITSGKSVHDCLFSPQHMISTQCQSYFLFIGRLAATDLGVTLLKEMQVFKQLEYLATTTNNDCYVKLIISSMDYTNPGPSRDLLKSVLQCSVEGSRLYATQFLLVLLRAGINHFSDWGIRLLVDQLQDTSRSVHLTTLSILHEACEIEECLLTLIKLNPNLEQYGERGLLLNIRLLSIPKGFQLLNQNDYIINMIKRWDEKYNFRYIKLVEGDTSDALTLHQRDDDGKYDKRTSSIRSSSKKEFFLPPHLYGQLSRHNDGSLMLLTHGSLESMIQCMESGVYETDDDILHLKASLWAVGHFASTADGLLFLILHNGIVVIVNLAQHCPVFSIRATAYYVIGLIASTKQGADELFKLGWFTTRHNRHITWPLIEEEAWVDENDDSLRINYDFPELYCFDSGLKEVEDSTDDDVSSSLMITMDTVVPGQQKSLTLPTNQNLPSSYHKRSLSESKTFEMIKAHDKMKDKPSYKLSFEMSRRIRNNSTTESTTSGVSSCDSVGGGKSAIYERQQILSPIPSSCSLSTLKHGAQKLRRHSESSRRVSLRSDSTSDKSTHSFCGTSSNPLSHQDLVGYATLRSLRKSPRYLEEPSYLVDEDSENSVIWGVPSNFATLNEDFLNASLPSLSSVKRFSINGLTTNEERCYMGISLPKNIECLFPDDDKNFVFLNSSTLAEDETSNEISELSLVSNSLRQHDIVSCLNCSIGPPLEEELFAKPSCMSSENLLQQNCPDSLIRLEILHLVDKFSNPIWNKPLRQTFLQWKQRSPHIFQDLCLYSEVCKMMSESTYRLIPRRILHELFYEFNYTILQNKTEEMLKQALEIYEQHKDSDSPIESTTEKKITENCNSLSENENKTSKQESSDSEKTRMFNIKSLDSLKLAYKENKFPIRKRNESKIL